MSISPLNLKAFDWPVVSGMTKRIAKKNISRYFRRRAKAAGFRSATKYLAWRLKGIERLDTGDLVQDCTGLNGRIKETYPTYIEVGKGLILIDVDLTMEDGRGCSMYHCGVTTPKTYEEAEAYRDSVVAEGPSCWNFDLRYSKEAMTIHPDGTFTQNYDKLNKLIEQRENA